jgi:hypothetical protein
MGGVSSGVGCSSCCCGCLCCSCRPSALLTTAITCACRPDDERYCQVCELLVRRNGVKELIEQHGVQVGGQLLPGRGAMLHWRLNEGRRPGALGVVVLAGLQRMHRWRQVFTLLWQCLAAQCAWALKSCAALLTNITALLPTVPAMWQHPIVFDRTPGVTCWLCRLSSSA